MKVILKIVVLIILSGCYNMKDIRKNSYVGVYFHGSMVSNTSAGPYYEYYQINIQQDSLTIYNISTYHISSTNNKTDTTSTVTGKYSKRFDIITTNNPEIPILKIKGNKLIAPTVNQFGEGYKTTFKNLEFKPSGTP